MISPNIINNIGSKVLWTITVENKAVPNTGVYVNLIIPNHFSISDTILSTNGSVVVGITTNWNIGNLAPNEVAKLILELNYDGPTAGFDVDYDFEARVYGLDTLLTNNTLIDTVTYKSLACGPLGGGVEDFSGCLCINVAENDTPCTEGTSSYVLSVPSITNSTTYHWDAITGIGSFTPIDPTLPVTGTYTLTCTSGEDTVQVSCDVPFTIYPQLQNKNIFDHTIRNVDGSTLSPTDIAKIQTLPDYNALSDLEITSACWTTLRNKDGVLTSATQLDCNAKQDVRAFFECSAEACTSTIPADVLLLVNAYADYTPEIGDVVFVQFETGHSFYKWNGTTWAQGTCGCIKKISTDAGNLLTLGTDNAPLLVEADLPSATPYPTAVSVTGTDTKTLTLTMSGANPPLTTNFTDLNTNPKSIELFIPPFNTDVGIEAVLHVSGITNLSPLWNTWIWQTADIYGSGTAPNPSPTWVDSQTGGLDYTVAADDKMVRVVLTDGVFTHYSNESGYDDYQYVNPYSISSGLLSTSQAIPTGTTTLDFTSVINTNVTYLNASAASNNINVLVDDLYKITYSLIYDIDTPATIGAKTLTIDVLKDATVLAGCKSVVSSKDDALSTNTISKTALVRLTTGLVTLRIATTTDITLRDSSIVVERFLEFGGI